MKKTGEKKTQSTAAAIARDAPFIVGIGGRWAWDTTITAIAVAVLIPAMTSPTRLGERSENSG